MCFILKISFIFVQTVKRDDHYLRFIVVRPRMALIIVDDVADVDDVVVVGS